MWKIKQIFDGDYGCEELAEGQTPGFLLCLLMKLALRNILQ